MAPKKTKGLRPVGKNIKTQVDKIKRSPKARAELQKHAQRLAARGNKTLKQKQKYVDYDWSLHPGDRHVDPTATVFTRSNHAKYSNAKHNTLLRLL